MTIRKIILGGTCLALVMLIAPAQADQARETVVVTANPPDPVGNDAFSFVRVTPKQLRASQQLDTALKEVPGLSLFRRDGSLSANPTVQGVTLRSLAPSGAGRALVTLDGVPQNDPFGNWVIWSALPGEDMRAGQIVRGAGAGPYGAGALTGVIALDEATGTGLVAADVSGGSLGERRAAASGGAELDRFQFFASASAEASDGWIPVAPDQRGAADDALTLDAQNASLRVETMMPGDTLISGRVSAYHEERNSGLVGAESSADGKTASLTVAHPESAGDLGWRMQVWMRDVGLTNSSVSIGLNRASTTVTNDQYAVPATGWGGNAALRGQWDWLNWEVGADARLAEGESRELFSTGLASRRVSGGTSGVEGLYVEGASRFDGWLVTLGARVDGWSTSNGHLIESAVATGAITKQQFYPSRSGTLPTARAGVRYDLSDSLYLRTAAYEGFRAPSLNELYRPFRVGQIVTNANPALTPEELYGTEIGAGGNLGGVTWQGTVFWNQLHDAIATVTTGTNVTMRENAGDIDAYGIEADARYPINDMFALTAAFDDVDASLNGHRPQQAPRWTATGGVELTPLPKLTADINLRYESKRFSDDVNTPSLALDGVTTADARISYALTGTLSVYVYGDNLFNARVGSVAANQQLTDGAMGVVTNYAAPRIIGGGVSFAQ
ncbi:MAG TPA: TonB-dependent receptor [Rhizomicrobium sp.]|nr:TonB-dependent receptor [Rhizomicrobium sp.]